MKKWKYMHTVYGKPGTFDGDQICFGARLVKLAEDYNQIRREQRATIRFRRTLGITEFLKEGKYGCVRVAV